MIVKNEAGQLAECLKSVAPLADEICIVDTGSEDNTIEVARRYHAKTSFFIWCNDFSAARNESLRQCTCDWVFVLDADERLTPQDLDKIRALARGGATSAYRFTTRNYTNSTTVSSFQPCESGDRYARGFAGWYPSSKVRLFPNHRGIEFTGRVHEIVVPSLEREGIRVEETDVPIHHYPYTKSPEHILNKQALYLKLGHEKIQERPGDPKAYTELADQYAEARDYTNAAGAYREALRLDPSNPNTLKNLGGMLHLLKRDEEAKRALELALALNPELTEAWRNLGVVHADQKEWLAAEECFRHALDTNPGWIEGLRYLSLTLERSGRFAEAAEYAAKALEHERSVEALKLYIHQMLRLEQRDEARQVLKRLIEQGVRDPEFFNAVGELYYYDDQFEDAIKHFEEAGEAGISSAYNNMGVAYYRQKKYGEAREAFEKCLALDPGHRGARKNLEKILTSRET
jgi:tetratricopeptide (TPR) repeat protein